MVCLILALLAYTKSSEGVLLLCVGYFLGLLFFSFVVDFFWDHPMCELCVLQRLWMFCLAGFAGFAVYTKPAKWLWVSALGTMLLIGLSAAVWQFYLYQQHSKN